MSWDYVAVIPGVDIRVSLEAAGIALVPMSDSRLQLLVRNNPRLAEFLGSFQSPFSEKLSPTVVLSNGHSQPVDPQPLVDLRNIAAVCSVLWSRANSLRLGRLEGAPHTDIFDFYPINMGRGLQGVLTIQGPAERGMHWLSDVTFVGQPAPTLVFPEQVANELDPELASALTKLLARSRGRAGFAAFRRRVFRSLQMAAMALRAWHAHLGTKADRGQPYAMWVSAFEVLAPRPNGYVGISEVEAMIVDVPWHTPSLHHKTRLSVGRRNRKTPRPRVTLPVQVYGRAYGIRNQFLHGNALPRFGIEANRRAEWGYLRWQLPVLYRNVLLHRLAQEGIGEFPINSEDPSTWGKSALHMRRWEWPLLAKPAEYPSIAARRRS